MREAAARSAGETSSEWVPWPGIASLRPGSSAEAREGGVSAGRPVVATDPKAIVETISGRVRGYISNSVFTFKGIPYGGPTGGAAPYQPPTKPEPWSRVRRR